MTDASAAPASTSPVASHAAATTPVDPVQTAARIVAQLAVELAARPAQVQAAIALMDEGATVPFIARYRKEVTGGLDDTQLRLLDERLVYLRELEQRRAAILDSIATQGKLDAERVALAARIKAFQDRVASF